MTEPVPRICSRGHQTFVGQQCIQCTYIRLARIRDRRRKSPVAEPEVETVPFKSMPSSARILTGFWYSLARGVKLLGPHEVKRIDFSNGPAYYFQPQGLDAAARRVGVKVGYRMFGHVLYVWRSA